MIRENVDAARELARGLRGDRLLVPLDRRHLLGRVALLSIHGRRDRHARSGGRRAARALPRRRRAHRDAQPLRRSSRFPTRGAIAWRALVAREGAVALRPLRLRVRRQAARPSSSSTTPTRRPRCSKRRSRSGAGSSRRSGPANPDADQFNSLHEKLIASWRAFAVTWSAGHASCTSRASATARRTAATSTTCATSRRKAAWTTRFVADRRDRLGRDRRRASSTTTNEEIRVLCKLYPWEWLAAESFGPHLLRSQPARDRARVEDAAVQQGHPADPVGALPRPSEPAARVLRRRAASPATTCRSRSSRARAPTSRSTAAAARIAADGEYGEEGFVYQAYAPIPRFGDDYATIGAWIIGDEPAGIGMREDESPITRNTSRFVPHYFTLTETHHDAHRIARRTACVPRSTSSCRWRCSSCSSRCTSR